MTDMIASGALRRRVALVAFLGALAGAGPAARGDDAVVAFRSPSGNIHCVIDASQPAAATVGCELRDYTGPAPAKPRDCELDWVPGASLDAKGRVAVFACQGDTLQSPDARVLAYGSTIARGGITCSSAATGMTCTVASGRGFLVSRAAIRRL